MLEFLKYCYICEMKHYKAIIFDFDGTLFNKKGIGLRLVMSDLRHIKYIWAERKTREEFRGKDCGDKEAFLHAFFNAMAAKVGRTEDVVREWYYSSYMKAMQRVLKRHFKPRRALKELLCYLRSKGVCLVVFSDYPCVVERLNILGIPSGLFDYHTSSEFFGALKPSSRPLQEIVNTIGMEISDVLMVGDKNSTDGLAAHSLSMDYIHIVDGEDKEKKIDGFSPSSMTWNEFDDYLRKEL